MDREWLSTELGRGRSIESLAAEVGLHASTLSYWARQYGLTSAHAARHAAKGPLDRAELEALVAEGLTIRQIAERLHVTPTRVRHWLGRYGLRTHIAARRDATAVGLANELPAVPGRCHLHGEVLLVRRDTGYRCQLCRVDAVTARRRRVKAQLVGEAGGACVACGYAASHAALQFHHLDPAAKEFAISHRGLSRSLDAARREAARCVLLCANCHAEVEAGVRELRFPGDEPSAVARADDPG